MGDKAGVLSGVQVHLLSLSDFGPTVCSWKGGVEVTAAIGGCPFTCSPSLPCSTSPPLLPPSPWGLCGPGWPQASYVAEDDTELSIPLARLPGAHTCITVLLYRVLGAKPRPPHKPGRHTTNSAVFFTSWCVCCNCPRFSDETV